MIKPPELNSDEPYGAWSCRGSDIWDTFQAAHDGDTDALEVLSKRDPNLVRAEYWYTQSHYFAVREGHLHATRLLLDAGADPGWTALNGDALISIASDRNHHEVVALLEKRNSKNKSPQPSPPGDIPPIHQAITSGDLAAAKTILKTEPEAVNHRDAMGGKPLHRAVAASAREMVVLLLQSGADIHGHHGNGPASASGYPPVFFQPIDLALWNGPFWGIRGDLAMVRLLLDHGANLDLTVAAALGNLDWIKKTLETNPERLHEARPCGKRPLSTAVEFDNPSVVRLLLELGTDPNWSEGANAPGGIALHAAARLGNRAMVELLLAHGADPNGIIDSSGSATYVAKTGALRSLLMAHGGTLDTFDLAWLGEDDEVVRRVSADPKAALDGCGGVFAAACTLGKQDLLKRVLKAGARVPASLTPCRSYLMHNPPMLRMLLESGMDPNLPNWQRATPLHDVCGRDSRGRPMEHRLECAAMLLDAGASFTAKDEDYRSTPLAWAARNNLPDMVNMLLQRGAPMNLNDDEPWATPLAWAKKRDHESIIEILEKQLH